MHAMALIILALALGVLTGVAPPALGADTPDADETATAVTPPRLSLVEGEVSFWRPGAEDWAQAQVNTPLAPGDELSTGSPGGLEFQIGARAFVRAAAETQVGLENQEPDFLQVKVTAGGAAFDLRALEPGHSLEVDTPSAAFIIEHAGYYRVDVTGERTSFITRRGGRATVTPASGEAVAIAPGTHVVVEGVENPRVATYPAPESDDWDRWNYARTKQLLQPGSARYVAAGTYGVSDLDRYGTWRTMPTYGPVWVPRGVPRGWAPYTTGAWMLDPVYGWTWVDIAPWGWAPYHHGRWVYVDGFWAWAPGPVVRRAVYAPALVAFLGGVSVGVAVGGPTVGWVALGWGEPLVPWWWRPGFAHVPSWHGWGGPRLVNNVVISKTTVVNVQNINVYHNTRVQNAVVVVNQNHFGRGPITASARIPHASGSTLRPIHAGPQVVPTAASFVPSASRGIRPPEERLQRRVVATRPPRHSPSGIAAHDARPKPHVVSVPQRTERPKSLPPSGPSTVERAAKDRGQPASPATRERPPQGKPDSQGAPPVAHQGRSSPRREPQDSGEAQKVRRAEPPHAPGAAPAGERANHPAPKQVEAKPPQQAKPPASSAPVGPVSEKKPREPGEK